uniref:Hsp70 family protein n=1 Tax=Rhodococcus opacus TaxID=37919 RepID=UPI000A588CDB
MAAALGIGVGSVNTVAAVDTDGASVTDAADLTVLSRASVLHLSPDRAPVLGDDTSEPDAVTVSDFANRVGDPVGILTDDGSTYSGEDLVATAVSCIVHEAASGRHGLPTTVVAHPTVWPPYTVGVLADALEQAGVTGATLVSEAQAVMTWLERTRGTLGDALTVIYDLGGTSLDITLFRSDAHGTETGVLGKPVRSEDFGGAHFDHATMQYVLGNVAEEFGDIDPFAPDTVAALTRLRTRCTAAKEALSSDTEATIGIELPGISTDVRLVRSELEDLIRESLQESVTLVRESIHAAGLESSDVTQVVLTGGSAAIPLVAELLSAELRVPVVAAERPGHTAALGAALLAADN